MWEKNVITPLFLPRSHLDITTNSDYRLPIYINDPIFGEIDKCRFALSRLKNTPGLVSRALHSSKAYQKFLSSMNDFVIDLEKAYAEEDFHQVKKIIEEMTSLSYLTKKGRDVIKSSLLCFNCVKQDNSVCKSPDICPGTKNNPNLLSLSDPILGRKAMLEANTNYLGNGCLSAFVDKNNLPIMAWSVPGTTPCLHFKMQTSLDDFTDSNRIVEMPLPGIAGDCIVEITNQKISSKAEFLIRSFEFQNNRNRLYYSRFRVKDSFKVKQKELTELDDGYSVSAAAFSPFFSQHCVSVGRKFNALENCAEAQISLFDLNNERKCIWSTGIPLKNCGEDNISEFKLRELSSMLYYQQKDVQMKQCKRPSEADFIPKNKRHKSSDFASVVKLNQSANDMEDSNEDNSLADSKETINLTSVTDSYGVLEMLEDISIPPESHTALLQSYCSFSDPMGSPRLSARHQFLLEDQFKFSHGASFLGCGFGEAPCMLNMTTSKRFLSIDSRIPQHSSSSAVELLNLLPQTNNAIEEYRQFSPMEQFYYAPKNLIRDVYAILCTNFNLLMVDKRMPRHPVLHITQPLSGPPSFISMQPRPKHLNNTDVPEHLIFMGCQMPFNVCMAGLNISNAVEYVGPALSGSNPRVLNSTNDLLDRVSGCTIAGVETTAVTDKSLLSHTLTSRGDIFQHLWEFNPKPLDRPRYNLFTTATSESAHTDLTDSGLPGRMKPPVSNLPPDYLAEKKLQSFRKEWVLRATQLDQKSKKSSESVDDDQKTSRSKSRFGKPVFQLDLANQCEFECQAEDFTAFEKCVQERSDDTKPIAKDNFLKKSSNFNKDYPELYSDLVDILDGRFPKTVRDERIKEEEERQEAFDTGLEECAQKKLVPITCNLARHYIKLLEWNKSYLKFFKSSDKDKGNTTASVNIDDIETISD